MMHEILIVLGVILGLVLTGVLNRLRGTGLIKHFGTLKIQEHKFNIFKKEYVVPEMNIKISLVWNHIFALYYGLIFGVVSGLWYVGLLVIIAYIIGESKGWGEWLGTLVRVEPKDEEFIQNVYADNEGKKFPFMHQISNYFIKEQISGALDERCKQHEKYSTLALILRGMYWFIGIEIIAICFGLLPLFVGLYSVLAIGFSFPLACLLGKITNLNGKVGIVNYSIGWENQELYFGMFQFIFIILPILIYSY